MWNYMKDRDVFVKSNSEGVKRVMNENYAYLMESTSLGTRLAILYERRNIFRIWSSTELQFDSNRYPLHSILEYSLGGVLGSKGYGIALQKSRLLTFRPTANSFRIRMDRSAIAPNPSLSEKRDNWDEEDEMVAKQGRFLQRHCRRQTATHFANAIQRVGTVFNTFCWNHLFRCHCNDRVLHTKPRTRKERKCKNYICMRETKSCLSRWAETFLKFRNHFWPKWKKSWA